MGVRILGFIGSVLLGIMMASAWCLICGAIASPAYAAPNPDCCHNATAAYALIITDNCGGSVTITIANPSTTTTGHITINADKPFELPPNTAQTHEVMPVDGLVRIKAGYAGKADVITHEWAKPTGCLDVKLPPLPPTAKPSTPPAPVAARPTPSEPAPLDELAGEELDPTPGKGEYAVWSYSDAPQPGLAASATGMLALTTIAMIWPWRRPRERRAPKT